MMHALVTGATGFLGGAIVEQLVARGDRVRAFCRRDDARLRALGVEIVLGDLGDADAAADACRGVDCVFHAAAIAGIWGRWSDYWKTNVLGTQAVAAGCLRHSVGRLVYTSSPSVTFDGRDQVNVDESAPYSRRFLAHYPRSKAMAEQHVLALHAPGRLAVCALRPHLIWGPGDRHLVPRLLARARAGRLRRIGSGRNLIDMIYIDNAAAAHLAAADRLLDSSAATNPGGRAYFLSQGEPVSCWPWIDEILARAGLPPVRRRLPLAAAWALGALCEAVYSAAGLQREPPMTRFLALQLGRSHYFNISAARKDLGYRPAVQTAEGMERLAQWLHGREPVRGSAGDFHAR